MNIKSLILGSAAALVAVSGARAADAVVLAEPEPVEYVRVCDAYGTGFFYIPGTETCLQISGYVRYQIGTSDNDNDGWTTTTRARLNIDARSDTEWGTLRGFLRYQATWSNQADGPVSADQAIVQLGGFYAGYTESAWAAPWGLPGASRFGLLLTDRGGSYAYQQRHQIGYIFNTGGFFGSLVLEDDTLAGEGYMPDVVGNIGFTQSWGTVWARAAYDESVSEAAIQAGVQVNIGSSGSSFRLGGYYATDPNQYAFGLPITGNAAEWAIAANYTHVFNPNWSATIGAQYLDGFVNDNDGFLVEAAVVWTPVTNFEIRLEGYYDTEDGLAPAVDDDRISGFLRFTRYF